jgi:hypothetical protein
MNKLKWSLVLIFGIFLFLIVRYNKSGDLNYKLEKDVREMKNEKDSLFTMADSVAMQIEVQKKIKQSQIEELQSLLLQKERNINLQKENLEKINKEKESLVKEKENVAHDKVMAVGYDIRGMEEELKRNRQIMEQMSYYNSILINELDSIKLQYDSLLVKYNQLIQK